MKSFNSILLIAFFSFSIFSCNKDDDTNGIFPTSTSPTKTKTRTQLLTQAPWIGTALTVNPALDLGDITTTDIWNDLFINCEKDDLHFYNEDMTYYLEEGATKCDPIFPQIIESGTWYFNGDETTIIVPEAISLITSNRKIISITETELVIEFEMEFPFDENTFTYSFRHP